MARGEVSSVSFTQLDHRLVVESLRRGLARHFDRVAVDTVVCPDLTGIGATSKGLGGSTALLEFGGEPYAHNPKYRGTRAHIDSMLEGAGIPHATYLGAAMADARAIGGHCGEVIANGDSRGRNLSRVARVGRERECVVEPYPATTCGPIANLFVSEGTPGDVIRVEVRRRTSDQGSLTQAMRESLGHLARDGGHIGLGGVVQLVGGRVRSHVMPDYECIEEGYYDTRAERVVREFLQFYEHMGPGLLLFCTLWTGDPSGGELNLRPSGEHTHFHHLDDGMNQAGHYHGDVSPEEVHYQGYFNLAAKIFRFGNVYRELGLKP